MRRTRVSQSLTTSEPRGWRLRRPVGGETSSSSRFRSPTSAPANSVPPSCFRPSDTIGRQTTASWPPSPRSAHPRPLRGTFRFPSDDQAAGGLLKPSIVKVGKLITLDRRLIRRTLGRFPDATIEVLLAEVQRFFTE